MFWIHEDEDLLVVNKPPGLSTHTPDPLSSEGLFEWLRGREPRWSALAILHRLDKETSGVLVFGKSAAANRSLTRQFEDRTVEKRYVLVTDCAADWERREVRSWIVRRGEFYRSQAAEGRGGEEAITQFRVRRRAGGRTWIEAQPLTGRTHQVRVHAQDLGVPILGDALYGGAPHPRVCLHAERIAFEHPSGGRKEFEAAPEFETDRDEQLRRGLLEMSDPGGQAPTDALRWIHGAADGWPGLYADQLGEFWIAESESALAAPQLSHLIDLGSRLGARAIYHRISRKSGKGAGSNAGAPQPVWGAPAPDGAAEIVENGIRFGVRFDDGLSAGVFLDQRENRRRILRGRIGAGFEFGWGGRRRATVLNTFAYTCGFSVCAAKAGARVTSVDLSRKYLDVGRANMVRNGIDPGGHDFLFGDVFGWLRRLARRRAAYDLVIVDPPTFSRSRESGVFQVERDFARLIAQAARLTVPRGILLASSNAARWDANLFLEAVRAGVRDAGREIVQERFVPQPMDFPAARAEPAYLKTIWIELN